MIFNKEKRIEYLGFNDIWFVVFGCLLISLITSFLFNDSFLESPFLYMAISWGISLFFTFSDWFFIRTCLIFMRKKMPDLKDTVLRILIVFFTSIIAVTLIDYFGNMLFYAIFGDDFNPETRPRVIIPVMIISTMVQAIYEAVFYFVKLKKSILVEEQSKQAIVQAQLDALKNQSQPHFFFNSMNTLRDIIDHNTKEDAIEFVNKLSNVFRFILESANSNLISLKDELSFAHSYIHIQKERFGDNLQVNWNVSENDNSKMIVPLSLQLLLENAIKHNVVSRSKPLKINIETKDKYLCVSNHIQLKSTKLPSTKLGLKNIVERYRLISDEKPQILNSGKEFKVLIPLLNAKNK